MVREGQSGCVGKSKTLRAAATPAYETDADAARSLHDRDNSDRAGTRTDTEVQTRQRRRKTDAGADRRPPG